MQSFQRAVPYLRTRLKVVGNKSMSPHLDLPQFKDPHIAATYAYTISNCFNDLAMEDCCNRTQFKETVMVAAAEMIGKNSMKHAHGSLRKCLQS